MRLVYFVEYAACREGRHGRMDLTLAPSADA